jgi:hypothetical protein
MMMNEILSLHKQLISPIPLAHDDSNKSPYLQAIVLDHHDSDN